MSVSLCYHSAAVTQEGSKLEEASELQEPPLQLPPPNPATLGTGGVPCTLLHIDIPHTRRAHF